MAPITSLYLYGSKIIVESNTLMGGVTLRIYNGDDPYECTRVVLDGLTLAAVATAAAEGQAKAEAAWEANAAPAPASTFEGTNEPTTASFV